MSDKDQIKELFSQKLGGYEAKVNPELWANISSQIGTTAAASSAAGGMSLLTKAIIGISAASVITTGAILYYNSEETTSEKEPQKTEVQRDSETTIDTEPKNDVSQPVADSGFEPTTDVEPVDPVPTPNNHQNVPTTGPNDGKASTSDYMEHKEEIDAQRERELKAMEEQRRMEQIQERKRLEAEEAKRQEMLVKEAEEKLHIEDAVEKQEVKDEKPEESAPLEFELPNIITTNGDGTNDVLKIKTEGVQLKRFYISILDQNGTLVYESQDPNFQWDGINMNTGERVKEGIHNYVVIAEDSNGRIFKKSQYLMVTF